MIRNFYQTKKQKTKPAWIAGFKMLPVLQGSSPSNLGPWPCLALGEEPLANRWRQRSTADQPGAQQPSQGPDIQPRTRHRHRHKSQEPRPEPRLTLPTTLPAPLRDAPPSLQRALSTSTTPALWRGAPESLTSALHKCVCTAHTRACHMPTRSLMHTPHTAHTPTFMYVHTYTRHSYSSAKKACTCVCVCV